MMFDEPTSALDPMSTSKIEDLIDQLKLNYTIVIVTHNMQQAGRISDKTCFFLNGYIEEIGSTDQIFFNPQSSKTEDYISGKFG
jgi:phosphate transport system ATP-binding protein